MQNKANFRKSQMNVNLYNTTNYEEKSDWTPGENKPNSKPIGEDKYKTKDPRHKTKDTGLESEVWGLKSGRKGKIDAKCVFTKDYEENCGYGL